MGYRRHAAVTLNATTVQDVSAIPTTDELLILFMGEQINGAGDTYALRPNADTGANYAGVLHFGSSTPSSNAQATITNGLHLGGSVAGGLVQGVYRLAKVGNYWLMHGSNMEERVSGNFRNNAHISARWNSLGLTLTSLRFAFNYSNATTALTGRLEVWYREG